MSPKYSSYEQKEEIELFTAFALKANSPALFGLAADSQNGCCRGLSMVWLKRGCSAAGMSITNATGSSLQDMVSAAVFQRGGSKEGADLQSQLASEGLHVAGNPATFTEDGRNQIEKALRFILGASGRYFLALGGGTGEAIRGHAIAALHMPANSKLFDPNAGELAFAADSSFASELTMVLKHYFARGYDTIRIFYLGTA